LGRTCIRGHIQGMPYSHNHHIDSENIAVSTVDHTQKKMALGGWLKAKRRHAGQQKEMILQL
jgi:hypothetical protein